MSESFARIPISIACESANPAGSAFRMNAANNPTIIFRDHLDNVPAAVRSGAFRALSCSLNVRNRGSKREKFRFSTSEDAVTWTVFS
jgi:hypothetical protein